MKEKEAGLYIPQGIKTRREYFDGFGKEELMYLIVSVLISALAAYVSYSFFHNLFGSMLIVMIVPTMVVFLSIKTETNMSVFDEMKLLLEYQKSQKHYPYIALNEWEK